MHVTVILCTYNRCASLARALQSAAALEMPPDVPWEVLVVDNNSRDETPAVVEKLRGHYPGRFLYMFEPHPGKSNALNSAIREARGDVLAFMDDDVVVESAWLSRLTAQLHDGRWAGAGGRIMPEKGFSLPPWIATGEPRAVAPLAFFDLGPEPGQLKEPPFGTSMAFRKEMFERYGGFRTDLGPRPGNHIRSEDTEFGQRVLAGGERLWYEPSAIVYHPVPEGRLQKDYFLHWYFDKGRADVRERGGEPETKTRWFVAGVPLFLFRRFVMWSLRWAMATGPAARFSAKAKVWGLAGTIKEMHHMASGKSKEVLRRSSSLQQEKNSSAR